MSDLDPLAAHAYSTGMTPLDFAETRVRAAIDIHIRVMAGRREDPSTFPGYDPSVGTESFDTDIAALSRRILGGLLDAGWTMPEPPS